MVFFPPPVSFSNQSHLGIATLLFRYQNKIAKESFKIAFPLLIPILIIRTPKTQDNCIHITFNFLFITISMYVSATKAKVHDENSVHKDRKLPKNLNGSNWAQIGLETGSKTLIFCYKKSISTK